MNPENVTTRNKQLARNNATTIANKPQTPKPKTNNNVEIETPILKLDFPL